MKKPLSWSVAHDLEKQGRWQDAIDEILKATQRMPEFSHLFALDIDRILHTHHKSGKSVSYSAYGLSPASVSSSLNPYFARILKQTKNLNLPSNTILNASRLIEERGFSEALRYAFENAHDKEIDAINLLYANQAVKSDKLWLYFLNKYLSQFKMDPLRLTESDECRFFRIAASQQKMIEGGPLVSVLVAAHNAEKTLAYACASLLNQTWRSLELILVDDASTDQTWAICMRIAKTDSRVKLHRNSVNVGPYVSKNLALQLATGKYLTCHDADDWALPDRIARQVALLETGQIKASTGTMLRMTEDGQIVRFSPNGRISDDGALRKCFVSMFFETKFFRQKLVAWDSVRVGADSELMARAEILANGKIVHDRNLLMICLDHPASLTRDPDTGIHANSGLSPARLAYQTSWKAWHKAGRQSLKIRFPVITRSFEAPREIWVKTSEVKQLFKGFETNYKEGWIGVGQALREFKDMALTAHVANKFRSVFAEKSWPKTHPELFRVAHALARVRWEEGDFDAALVLLDQALQAVPDDFLLLQNIINWRLLIARSELNVKVLNRVYLEQAEVIHIKRLTTDPGFTHIVAESWSALGHFDRAKKHLISWTDVNPQLNLALANCNIENDADWLLAINAYFKSVKASPISLRNGTEPRFFRLNVNTPRTKYLKQGPMISVIMTAYNVAQYIELAIESVLGQTWRNLELIVVDDVSSDNTVALVEAMMQRDNRIRLIRNEANSGTYVGRNKAYQIAQGEFITCHDSDDWAHPEKLERQVVPLLNNPEKVASFSHQVRIYSDGLFPLKWPGEFARHNASSIMFSKKKVKSVIGYWDSVRIGADSEFIARLELAFGAENMVTLPEVLMLCAHRPMSLSRDPDVGININGLSGPRREYRAAYRNWHESQPSNQRFVDFPLNERHFPVPNVILPTRASE